MVSNPITLLSSFPADFFIHWKDDVIKVRNLYRERKYRRCAVLCSERLKEAIHPVHRTFLYFYQAVCYESLGHIAHNYSSNKIPLLEQARDAFILASETLPLPTLPGTDGGLETVDLSPICATLDIATFYEIPTPSSVYSSPCPHDDGQMNGTGSASSPPATQIPRTYSAPKFSDYSYSPRGTFNPTTPTPHSQNLNLLTPDQHHLTIHNHKNRLSQSLSSQHILAEDLIPSPLFSHGPSSKKESQCQSHASAQSLPLIILPLPLPQVSLNRPLPPTPINRPLPSLPFNHNPQFIRRGKRFVVVPRRKTALSTLISQFEGKVPFDGDLSPLPVAGFGQDVERTPVTERFRKISAIFVEKEERVEGNGDGDGTRNTRQKLDDSTAANTAKENTSAFCDYRHANTTDATSDTDTDSDKENTNPNHPHNHNHNHNYSPSRPLSTSTTTSPTKSLIPRLQRPTKYPQTPKTPCPTYRCTVSPVKQKPKPKHKATATSNPNLSTPVPLSTPSAIPTATIHPTTLPFPPPQPPPPPSTIPSSLVQSYPTLLLPLHKSLTSHITSTTSTILHTRLVQDRHDQEKRDRFLAAYRGSSLSTSTSTSTATSESRSGFPCKAPIAGLPPGDVKVISTSKSKSNGESMGNRNRTSHITPSKDARLRSFWSLRDAQANAESVSRGRGKNGNGIDDDDEILKCKRERITRLKEGGWIVGKEKVGFRGVGYYGGLVGDVVREMGLEGR